MDVMGYYVNRKPLDEKDRIILGPAQTLGSKISPTYPWKIPQKFHQQFMKEVLSLWG